MKTLGGAVRSVWWMLTGRCSIHGTEIVQLEIGPFCHECYWQDAHDRNEERKAKHE